MQQRVSNVSNPESYAIFNDSLPLDLVHSRTSVVLSPLVVCSLRLVVSTVKSFAPFHVLKRNSFRKVSPRASDNYFGASIRGYSTRAIRLSYLIVSRLDTRLCIRLASSAQCADRTLEVLEWGLLQRDFAPSHRDSVLQTIVSGPLSEGILPEQYAHLLLFHGSRIYCPINQLLSQSLTSNPSSSWLRACINLCCCPFLSPCLIPLPHFPTPSYPSL